MTKGWQRAGEGAKIKEHKPHGAFSCLKANTRGAGGKIFFAENDNKPKRRGMKTEKDDSATAGAAAGGGDAACGRDGGGDSCGCYWRCGVQ